MCKRRARVGEDSNVRFRCGERWRTGAHDAGVESRRGDGRFAGRSGFELKSGVRRQAKRDAAFGSAQERQRTAALHDAGARFERANPSARRRAIKIMSCYMVIRCETVARGFSFDRWRALCPPSFLTKSTAQIVPLGCPNLFLRKLF